MQIENYKPNSHRSKAEKEKKEFLNKKAITQGRVKKQNRVKGVIIQEDMDNIKSYVLMDVLIPTFKKAVIDIVSNSVSMLLYGDTNHVSRDKRKSNISVVSYDRCSDRRGSSPRRSGYRIDDIVLDTKEEAEDVIEAMDDLIDEYGVASIADLYDIVNISFEYTDNKYGWTSIRGFDYVRDRDGYLLRLPKARPID